MLGDSIIHAVVSEVLLSYTIRYYVSDGNYYGAFNREGWTPISRVFLNQAKKLNVPTTVFYTRAIMFESMYVPQEVDNLLVSSDNSVPEIHNGEKIVPLFDNFLNWRSISRNVPNDFCIGLLLGDDYNRWGEQYKLDTDILDTLSNIGNVKCIGRPHPQELRRTDRIFTMRN